MKYCINKNFEKGKANEINRLAELLIFVFSMCVITAVIIFASVEANNEKIKENEKSEQVSFIYDSAIYEIFDFDLLENDEIVEGVSKKEENLKENQTNRINK